MAWKGGVQGLFILLTVAIAPGLALFSYFYLRKQIAKEPSRTLFHTFHLWCDDDFSNHVHTACL